MAARPARRRLAAVLLAAAAVAACGDFLAAPAGGDARLSLALRPGGPAPQAGPSELFDAVDGLTVRVSRGATVVMADSFAVSPASGEIRRTLLVSLEGDEEELELAVELHAGGQPAFAGGRSVHLVRGRQTAAEIELLPVAGAGQGTLVVQVAHALTGAALPGAAVTARRGANAPTGDPAAAAGVTTAGGGVAFDSLAAGPYTLFVSAPGMIAATVAGVSVVADSAVLREVVLSPPLPAGETRIVLTWRAAPEDLDAHLLGPDGHGGTFHVSFADPAAPDSGAADVELDVDDQDGFGPETITVHRQFSGTYCFSVDDFSGEASLGASGAQVRVFRGSEQVAAFTAPATGARVWNVFRMSGTAITELNTTSAGVPAVCP